LLEEMTAITYFFTADIKLDHQTAKKLTGTNLGKTALVDSYITKAIFSVVQHLQTPLTLVLHYHRNRNKGNSIFENLWLFTIHLHSLLSYLLHETSIQQ
jgi:hypothetical protein